MMQTLRFDLDEMSVILVKTVKQKKQELGWRASKKRCREMNWEVWRTHSVISDFSIEIAFGDGEDKEL